MTTAESMYADKPLKEEESALTTTANYKTDEVEKALESNMSFLAAFCLPEICKVPFPDIYIGMWGLVTGALGRVRDFSKFALGLPRGHAKTTVIKILIIYIILFTKRKFILVTCANATLAENIISDVADILDSQNMLRVFGNWADARSINRAEQKRFFFRGRDIILAGLGSGGSPRGLNIKNSRPDVIICDDMQTKQEAESEIVSKNLLQWLVGTLMKAKAPDGCTYLYVGNMYRDMKIGGSQGKLYTCILRNLQLSKTWVSWVVGAIRADGTALWEELQPLEQLLEELANDIDLNCADVFYSEVLNDPKCGNSDFFDLSKLPKYDIEENVDIPVGAFLMIDPSLGKKKSDAQVVNHVVVYDGIPSIEYSFIKQCSAPDLVDWCLAYADLHKIPLICAESVAYQSTLLQWFEKIAKQKEITNIQFLPVSPQGRKKNSRIIQFFKALMAGQIKANPRVLAGILNQIASFNVLSEKNTDDILDTGAYTQDVMLAYPNELIYQHILTLEQGEGYGVVEDTCIF
jgi:hypothetical protein